MRHLPAAVVLLTTLVLPTLVRAEPAVRCTHRDDRPDLGSPVHAKQGGKSLQGRLPNGHGVFVLKTSGTWMRIRYADPVPTRSEPLDIYGWISSRYLKACPAVVEPPTPGSGALKLCWWNAKRLGHGKPSDWEATARAVEGCDIVGLGEVMTKDAPVKLAAEMGTGWKAVTSDKAVGRTSYVEYYSVVCCYRAPQLT